MTMTRDAGLWGAFALALLLPTMGGTSWGDDGHGHPHHAPALDLESAGDGAWSDQATWKPQRLPRDGDRVRIAAGTTVTFDLERSPVVRSLDIEGVLRFARDRSTELNVGVVRIGSGGHDHGSGVEDVHKTDQAPPRQLTSALEVGLPEAPIPAPHTARIRLHALEGMNLEDEPAIIARPGGRLDLHGAPLSRTWVKLGATAEPGASVVVLSQPVTGWRVGDEVIVTASEGRRVGPGGTYRAGQPRSVPTETERRVIRAIDETRITLDAPLKFVHTGEGEFRSEVANLSRTVIVESAQPDIARGHTMHHWGSGGSLSYARFAHLGKEGVLGRYPIHFHLADDTLRGSSVVGVAVVDSHNRWITIHGTHYMVVRDCVGYQSVGHGFFLEDGTEVYNVLDRNLAVQAFRGRRLPKQELPFDPNDAAGFWWANGRNTLIRNVSCENDVYGFRYDMQMTRGFDSHLPIRQPDGSTAKVDVRTIPIWRFEKNEAHTEGFYGVVVAANGNSQPDTPIRTPEMLKRIESIDWTGPDTQHPHHLRDVTIWRTHYAFRPHSPSMLMENVRIARSTYGIYRPAFENQVYRGLHFSHIGSEAFNRGMDDASAQTGRITVDGIRFEHQGRDGRHPLIQISDNDLSPDGSAESHFRNIELEDIHPGRALVDRGGSVRADPVVEGDVPIYLHDHFGPGRHARVVSIKTPESLRRPGKYVSGSPHIGSEALVAEVTDVEFPELLDPVDDQPPATILTWPAAGASVSADEGRLRVRGTSTDNGRVAGVWVNGQPAQPLGEDFHQWEVTLEDIRPGRLRLEAWAEDAAGLSEITRHTLEIEVR